MYVYIVVEHRVTYRVSLQKPGRAEPHPASTGMCCCEHWDVRHQSFSREVLQQNV